MYYSLENHRHPNFDRPPPPEISSPGQLPLQPVDYVESPANIERDPADRLSPPITLVRESSIKRRERDEEKAREEQRGEERKENAGWVGERGTGAVFFASSSPLPPFPPWALYLAGFFPVGPGPLSSTRDLCYRH